jgi:hypothetical protein
MPGILSLLSYAVFGMYIRVLVELSSTHVFVCIALCCQVHCFYSVFSWWAKFRLSSLVGGVWVVCYSFLRTAVLFVFLYGPGWYILLWYSLVNCISIYYSLVYCFIYLRSWENGVLWFLRTIEDVLGCSLLCLCTSAGGGTSRCCCSVHICIMTVSGTRRHSTDAV